MQPDTLRNMPVTIVDVWDESALCARVREDLYKSYPHAKLAHLKSGGNFPYLSRSDEVNLHLLVSIIIRLSDSFSGLKRKDAVCDCIVGDSLSTHDSMYKALLIVFFLLN